MTRPMKFEAVAICTPNQCGNPGSYERTEGQPIAQQGLDFIEKVNEWNARYKDFAADHKHVTVRTIKMKAHTADELRYSSQFNRRRSCMDQLRREGSEVARDWLDRWPHVGCYPKDAAYREL